jgi:hypothetical protein
MNCPACSNTLTELLVGDVRLDVCKDGCGGIWFDWMELKKLDEPHEEVGLELLNIQKNDCAKVDFDSKRKCPRCEETIIMLRHFSSVKREIEVDECGNCGGFWLDYGELNNLRSQFNTEEERNQAAKKYIVELVDPILETESKKSQDRLQKSQDMVSMFKFICPTYYMPGDQDFGAF